jgi:hypothetical protein
MMREKRLSLQNSEQLYNIVVSNVECKKKNSNLETNQFKELSKIRSELTSETKIAVGSKEGTFSPSLGSMNEPKMKQLN